MSGPRLGALSSSRWSGVKKRFPAEDVKWNMGGNTGTDGHFLESFRAHALENQAKQ
jgi:hypothetical protein